MRIRLLLVLLCVIMLGGCRKPKQEEGYDAVIEHENGGSGLVITLRTLEAARKVPQLDDLPENRSSRRGQPHVCPTDGKALVPAVFTTYGPRGDPAVWRAYPMAIEGWHCPAGHHDEYPAFLTAEEMLRLQSRGLAAIKRRDLDEAEFFFRRIVSSWSGQATAHVNLASVYLDRVRQERTSPGGGSPELIKRYTDVATAQLEKALTCEPPPSAQVRLMLGRVYIRSERRDKGRPLVERFLSEPDVPSDLKAEAEALLRE